MQLSAAILWSSGSRSHRDQISGGHSVGVPPVPIPNTAVKPDSAKDSRTAGSRKRRTSPDYFPPAPPSHQRDRGAGRLTHPHPHTPRLPQALHAPHAHTNAPSLRSHVPLPRSSATQARPPSPTQPRPRSPRRHQQHARMGHWHEKSVRLARRHGLTLPLSTPIRVRSSCQHSNQDFEPTARLRTTRDALTRCLSCLPCRHRE